MHPLPLEKNKQFTAHHDTNGIKPTDKQRAANKHTFNSKNPTTTLQYFLSQNAYDLSRNMRLNNLHRQKTWRQLSNSVVLLLSAYSDKILTTNLKKIPQIFQELM